MCDDIVCRVRDEIGVERFNEMIDVIHERFEDTATQLLELTVLAIMQHQNVDHIHLHKSISDDVLHGTQVGNVKLQMTFNDYDGSMDVEVKRKDSTDIGNAFNEFLKNLS